jgi:hypothetical protein
MERPDQKDGAYNDWQTERFLTSDVSAHGVIFVSILSPLAALEMSAPRIQNSAASTGPNHPELGANRPNMRRDVR